MWFLRGTSSSSTCKPVALARPPERLLALGRASWARSRAAVARRQCHATRFLVARKSFCLARARAVQQVAAAAKRGDGRAQYTFSTSILIVIHHNCSTRAREGSAKREEAPKKTIKSLSARNFCRLDSLGRRTNGRTNNAKGEREEASGSFRGGCQCCCSREFHKIASERTSGKFCSGQLIWTH